MSSIHQEISFAATPDQIYRALLDSDKFAEFTGASAKINPEQGGEFVCFGTFILGRNIQLIPEKLIVQAWRVFNWEEGLYSIVRFKLSAENKNTKLVLDQSGIPEDMVEHVDQGWDNKYWEPLRKYLQE